jgi:tetratricopeptide (TPR) repeat protein
MEPAHVPALVNRGAAFKDLRQVEKAIADFDLALAFKPAGWVNRGEALLVLERLGEALASFDKALSIKPELAVAWLGRANVLMLTRYVTDALAACERALAIEPNSVKALTQLGQCYALQGRAEAAISCFDRALAIKPDDAVALANRIYTLDFSEDGDFARHQAARFEVICYSASPTEDAVTGSFQRSADRWRNVLQWSDDRLADLHPDRQSRHFD